MAEQTPLCIAGIVAGVLGIIAILIATSFSSLEYYQYGFKRQKSTGEVSLEEVYTTGNHFVGPDYEFKTFKADGHFITLKNVRVFTADQLEVGVTANLQYYLRREDLKSLHQRFDVYYEDVMQNSAIDAIKGSVTIYSAREMFSIRSQVERTMFKAVRERLGGICCKTGCESSNSCEEGCTRADVCLENDKGLFAEVKYFQMGEVDIPDDVKERLLQALTLQEDSEREKLLQTAQVERKKTQSQVQKIKNQATEIRQEAEAQSQLLRTTSTANYTVTIESARSNGLADLFSTLNITQQQFKNSFDYLRTLRGLENVWLTVDFNQRIVGALGSK